MDTSGLPVPDAIHSLLEQLQEALVLEVKYQPNLQLPSISQNDEITIGARDGSAHVLRCLKVWYDLPSDVFFVAINLMDRFLTKMKARPKHMACISVSAFHIAAVQLAQSLDADHLVSISQCKCTAGDLKRMSEVIRNKLEWAPGTQPVTSLTFLRLFNAMFLAIASQLGLGDMYTDIVTESELLLRLEMVICDGNCASLKPSEVALVLLCTYLDGAVNRLDTSTDIPISTTAIPSSSTINTSVTSRHQMFRLMDFSIELQKICKISDASFFSTHEAVGAILSKYNAQEQTPHRQRLIWRLSSRTARLLRPTDRFTSVLPVIAEHAPVPSPSKIRYIF
ncbi:Cyclin-G2, partial [Eufriesea mexicana]